MTIRIVREPIPRSDLVEIARDQFGDLVKGVVDIGQRLIAIGGDLHADEEAALVEQGSAQEDLWGINLYPERTGDDWIECDSVINIRPAVGNRSRGVEDPGRRDRIIAIVHQLVV